MEVGFLHPEQMSETLAANCSESALWVSEGRSASTCSRAEQQGLTEAATLDELAGRADAINADE